ncbi:MAG TPA: hypothetical protein VIF09_18315 [Polyangiaceae bacterium]
MLLPSSRPFAALASLAALAALAVAPSACLPGAGGGNLASNLAKPPTYDAPGQSKCSVRKSAEHPLIVEWPSADRATLEAKAQAGLVAVHYVGCEMEVLHRCKLPGKYAYTSITPKHDAVTIKDADDLYANMPVGAAKLEGKLEKSGQLNVSMTIVGRFEADRGSFTAQDLDGEDCERATHVVSGMTTGAFELSAGASATVGAEAKAFGVGAGGQSSSTHETLERDGHEDKCEAGGGHAGSPPDGCGAVLRLDLMPLSTPKREHKAAAATAVEVDGDGITPAMYETGNLRVAALCAEHATVMTPDLGLRVVLDGKADAEKPLKMNLMTMMGTQTVNNHTVPVMSQSVTDIGFVVPPGPHHLSIQAPDCASLDTDVKISGSHETDVSAEMEVSADSLRGPVGAPTGFAWTLGAYGSPLPPALTNKLKYVQSVNGSSIAYGGSLGFTYEHRNFTFGMQYAVGSGSFSGKEFVTGASSGESPGPFPFTGSQFENFLELRIGARLPLRYVALMAGSGVGGSMWISNFKVDTSSVGTTGSSALGLEGGLAGLWHLPLWAAVDFKPVCDFGVQVGAAYNWDPTDPNGSFPMFNASLMWQPAPACSRQATVNVSP